jgi:hypothetical protein
MSLATGKLWMTSPREDVLTSRIFFIPDTAARERRIGLE